MYARVSTSLDTTSIPSASRTSVSASETTSSTSLTLSFLEGTRSSALRELSTATSVNDQTKNSIRQISDLLTDIQTTVTSFSALVGSTDSADQTQRTNYLSQINDLAQQINGTIDQATYQGEALLGGTYDGSGQLRFSTGLFGNALTTLPYLFSLRPQDSQVDLGSTTSTDYFSVEANGATLVESSDADAVADFATQISDAQDQVDALLDRVTNKELYLAIRTTKLFETNIEPTKIESDVTLSNTQQVVAGLYNNSADLININGLFISINA